jgi:hypothetical protein
MAASAQVPEEPRLDARLSRAGVVARLTSTSLCVSSEDPDRRCQGETHVETAITAGDSYRTEGPEYQGARCTCPRGAPSRPGWGHQRCIRVQGRSAADPGMVQLMVQIKGS